MAAVTGSIGNRQSAIGNPGAWLMGLVLGVVTLAVYWPVRRFDFVEYDDPEYVVGNDTVRHGLSVWGVIWSFVDAHASNWHPVTWLSHMLDCQVFGLWAGGHHLTNVLLHLVNSVLLFLLLRAMTGAFWRSALVAALFAWHPLRVESVAWVSERKDVLSGLFFVLTVWAYAAYARSRVQSPKSKVEEEVISNQLSVISRRMWVLALCFFALGLMSKPMLVTVPFVLLLLDYWPLGRVMKGEGRGASGEDAGSGFTVQDFLGPFLEKIPFFGLALVAAVITFFAQRSSGAVVSLKSEGIGARVANALVGYAQYLGKLFWPHDLSVLYLRHKAVSGSLLIIPVCVLVLISVWAGVERKRRPYLAVGWLWFVIMLLPVSGLVQAGLQGIADRYTYLPSIGIYWMVAWGLAGEGSVFRSQESGVRSQKKGRMGNVLIVGLAVATLAGCLILTREQLGYWSNTETLMGHALKIDPGNYIAHNDLAVYYDKHGQPEAARIHRQQMLELEAQNHAEKVETLKPK